MSCKRLCLECRGRLDFYHGILEPYFDSWQCFMVVFLAPMSLYIKGLSWRQHEILL